MHGVRQQSSWKPLKYLHVLASSQRLLNSQGWNKIVGQQQPGPRVLRGSQNGQPESGTQTAKRKQVRPSALNQTMDRHQAALDRLHPKTSGARG